MNEVRLRHPPGHLHSPIFDRTKTALPGIDLNLAGQERLVQVQHRYYGDLPFGDEPQDGLSYGYVNEQFSYADAVCLYGLMRHIAPRRIIEVGSGHSSALMLDVNERHFAGAIELTFIEPFPERLHRTRVLQRPVQDVPLETFDALESGDILFIDSTNVSKTGSDVNHLIFEVPPRLAPGVWVHFHDIHFPFEYPETWVEQGYAWNEAYLLRAFLMFNRTFEVQLFLTQAELLAQAWFHREMPICMKNPGGSLWLRRVE